MLLGKRVTAVEEHHESKYKDSYRSSASLKAMDARAAELADMFQSVMDRVTVCSEVSYIAGRLTDRAQRDAVRMASLRVLDMHADEWQRLWRTNKNASTADWAEVLVRYNDTYRQALLDALGDK